MKVKSDNEVAQSCLTLSDPMDCSPPGSTIHGIFQARVQSGVPSPSPATDTRSKIIAQGVMVAPCDFVIGKPTPSSKTEPIQYSPYVIGKPTPSSKTEPIQYSP